MPNVFANLINGVSNIRYWSGNLVLVEFGSDEVRRRLADAAAADLILRCEFSRCREASTDFRCLFLVVFLLVVVAAAAAAPPGVSFVGARVWSVRTDCCSGSCTGAGAEAEMMIAGLFELRHRVAKFEILKNEDSKWRLACYRVSLILILQIITRQARVMMRCAERERVRVVVLNCCFY